MPSAIKLRTDFTARELRRWANKAKDVNKSRRLRLQDAVPRVIRGINEYAARWQILPQ